MAFINDHLRWCTDRNLRPNTIAARHRVLERARQTVGDCLGHATCEDLTRWETDAVERLSPAARRVELSHLKQFFEWTVRFGLRPDNPATRLDAPRMSRRLPRPVDDDTLDWVLTHATGRVRHFVVFAVYAGLRACEVATVHAADIQDGRLLVRDGKGGKQRIVPAHPEIMRTVREIDEAGWLFPAQIADTGIDGHVTPPLVSTSVNNWLRTHGVDATMHRFRHTFATRIYASSHDLRVTQELLGHASPATTAVYAAWDQRAGAAAVAAL